MSSLHFTVKLVQKNQATYDEPDSKKDKDQVFFKEPDKSEDVIEGKDERSGVKLY